MDAEEAPSLLRRVFLRTNNLPQELLHDANIVACFEQVSGKAMAKGVRADRFIYFGQLRGSLDRPL